MNRPCRIHFHEDSSPDAEQLPHRYQDNLESHTADGARVCSLLVQNAFYIDYAPHILRTRVGGTREENPVDFPTDTISHVEWFFGQEVPAPLTPYVRPPQREEVG